MTDRAAVDALFAMIGAPKGFNVFTAPGREHWCAAGELRRFRFLAERLAYDGDLALCPMVWGGRAFAGVRPCSVLWARVETGDSVRRLERFQPPPSLIVREGGSLRRVAVLALQAPIPFKGMERANRRIAHNLGTAKKWCSFDGRIPVPGTVLRKGRTRPVPVIVESLEPALYSALEIVGRLKEAPDPDAWRLAA